MGDMISTCELPDDADGHGILAAGRAMLDQLRSGLLWFAYDHNLFGFKRMCGVRFGLYVLKIIRFDDIGDCRGPSCNYCRRYNDSSHDTDDTRPPGGDYV